MAAAAAAHTVEEKMRCQCHSQHAHILSSPINAKQHVQSEQSMFGMLAHVQALSVSMQTQLSVPPTPACVILPTDEKTAIARRYLQPQSRADSGVPEEAVDVADDAMDTLIQEYCRCERSVLCLQQAAGGGGTCC
jgi:hypothetical protein